MIGKDVLNTSKGRRAGCKTSGVSLKAFQLEENAKLLQSESDVFHPHLDTAKETD